ncbi:MAG: hypothetical protein K6A72_01210 [Lachnospiraceae bacterium]|nr:hypothetical protein [Lachnospiraceae bacterium]
MENKKDYLNIISSVMFVLLVVLPLPLWLGFSAAAPEGSSLKGFIDPENTEKRVLAELPGSMDAATLTSDYEAYYNDHLPFRNLMIKYYNASNSRLESIYRRHVGATLAQVFYSDEKDENGNEYMFPVTSDNELVLFGRDDWLFYLGENSLDYYRGTNVMDEAEMAEHLEKMEELQKICDEKGIQLAFLMIPNKETAYSENMPSYRIESEKRRQAVFSEYVNENSDIVYVYPLEELEAGKKMMPMYFKYDTHWNMAGAFVGMEALYEAMGLPTEDVENTIYKEEPSPASNGDLVSLGGLDPALYPDDVAYTFSYRPELTILTFDNTQTSDLLFSGHYKVTTDSPTGKSLVMLGDSFTLSIMNYMLRDFPESCFANRSDVFNIKDEVRSADIIVLESCERLDYRLWDDVDNLIEVLGEE